MSYFDIDPVESAQQINTATLNPLTPDSLNARWYEGIGTGVVQGVQSSYYRDIFNVSKATKDQAGADRAIEQVDALKPDPSTVGFVGQLMHGFGDTLGTVLLNVAGGNVTPQTAAMASAQSYANSQTAIHIREGMDPLTAEKVGRLEGIGVGLGVVAPAALPGSLLMRAASGGGINAVLGGGQRALISNTLNNAGYGEMAKQYSPFDGASIATDLAVGAFFGGLLGERPAGKEAPRLNPSDLDTVLTNNNAAHVELGTAPGIPTDPAARRVHVDTLNQAIEDLMAGREVSVKDDVTQANFVENPSAVETRTAIADAVSKHLDDLEGFKQELGSRGLPTDTNLYNVADRIYTTPIFAKSELSKLTDRALAESWSTEQLASHVKDLVDRMSLRDANKADAKAGDRVRGNLWIEERLTRAERNGELDTEQVRLAKWLIEKNPNIANDLAISLPDAVAGAHGLYDPIKRIATIVKNNTDPTTAVHEFLHHGERLMPNDVRQEIQKAWAAEVQRVTRMAEQQGSLDLKLFMGDVLKANLGMSGADQRLRDMVGQGLVSKEAYALVNPSEFWAVNASRIIRERASESWVRRAVQWIKELVGKLGDIFGIKNDSALVNGIDALLKSDGRISGDILAANAPRLNNLEAPGKNVGTENLNGFEPDLRVKVPIGEMKLPEKPLVLTGTNKKNAARQINNIDEILTKFPDADKSPLEWSKMMAYAMATDDVPVPPYRFLKDINSDGAFKSLSRLSPGQIADAQHGFENAAAFRDAYINKKLDVETTGKLFLWSFLSRGVSPYTQEGLFIDGFKGAGEWIKKAADGKLTEADFPAYEAWAKSVAPQGSGQPGSGATHNLNAFGRLFLFKMGQRDANGLSLLQTMHNMMEDPNMTGQQLRRWFIENTEGVGIDNKVVSFTLLVAGFKDLMVLDRVQIRQLWDDGRFGSRNLYDGRKVEGKPVAGSALSEITYGARGLLIYEAIERALAKRIENLYTALGRPQDGSVGRYHWETWVADSQQEASHGTLDAILHDAQGNPEKIAQVTAKEGEYGAYAYGARYGRDASGTPYFMYGVNGMPEYRFSVPAFREFLAAVKLPANDVVPTKFKVTEAGNAPWYERSEVNKQALDALAKRYAGEPSQGGGAGTVPENGQGQAISNSAGRAASDPYSPEALIAQSPALTIIREDGTMVSAGRALTDADAEIASAQRDSQGYDAAVACALRG